MGGQQFGEASVLVDTRALNRVLASTADRGPSRSRAASSGRQLIGHLQRGADRDATGSGGSIRSRPAPIVSASAGRSSCNAHGRGLNLKPIVQQVEAFDLVGPDGELRTLLADAEPRAVPPRHRRLRPVRHHLARRAEAAAARQGPARRRPRRDGGASPSASKSGSATAICTATTSSRPIRRATAFSGAACSRATSRSRRHAAHRASDAVQPGGLGRLTFYSHRYKRRAFETYSTRYLRTSGQVYWADCAALRRLRGQLSRRPRSRARRARARAPR